MNEVPSSRNAAGVPPQGSGKFVVVIVLFVFGIAGVLVWRFTRSEPAKVERPEPVVADSVAATPPPTYDPRFEEVPPPVPLARPDAASSTPRSVGTGGVAAAGGGGCEAKCVGKGPAELEQALRVRAAQSRRCYEQALTLDPTLKGRLTVAVKVGPGGAVCTANVISNELGSNSVAQCVANVFRGSGPLPAPKGGCVDATVPVSFVPRTP